MAPSAAAAEALFGCFDTSCFDGLSMTNRPCDTTIRDEFFQSGRARHNA
jgi:hypothetical protein